MTAVGCLSKHIVKTKTYRTKVRGLFCRQLPVALAACVAMQLATPFALADGGTRITAVASQVSDDYVRAKLPDGSLAPETYAFGIGGRAGGTIRDDSVDNATFMEVAKTLAVPLANRNFIPEPNRDPKKTKLLIMVYWGTTSGTEGASSSLGYENLQALQLPNLPPTVNSSITGNGHVGAGVSATAKMADAARQNAYTEALAVVSAENNLRVQKDARNAAMLGFDTELAEATGWEATAFRLKRDDLFEEIEANRYFVVLMAYDFQAMWKQKQHKLLWVTRMSVRERGANFGQILPAMVLYGSQFCGEDSHGLLRKKLPEGRVDLGDVKSLDVLPDK